MKNRGSRKHQAQEIVDIIKRGSYIADGVEINIGAQVRACLQNTRAYIPEELTAILKNATQAEPPTQTTRIELHNETTLAGAQRLSQSGYKTIMALNFASAKNPGGGFLKGSQAQEESLARSSALYASLCRASEHYAFHRQQRSSLYSHRMIVSPNCPVLRCDRGILLTDPYPISFITSPAPNAGALLQKGQHQEMQELPRVFQERAARVLALACEYQADALILGAWGCGVFQNDPAIVARTFGDLLQPGGMFANRIPMALFSVLDNSKNQGTFKVFAEVLGV